MTRNSHDVKSDGGPGHLLRTLPLILPLSWPVGRYCVIKERSSYSTDASFPFFWNLSFSCKGDEQNSECNVAVPKDRALEDEKDRCDEMVPLPLRVCGSRALVVGSGATADVLLYLKIHRALTHTQNDCTYLRRRTHLTQDMVCSCLKN